MAKRGMCGIKKLWKKFEDRLEGLWIEEGSVFHPKNSYYVVVLKNGWWNAEDLTTSDHLPSLIQVTWWLEACERKEG